MWMKNFIPPWLILRVAFSAHVPQTSQNKPWSCFSKCALLEANSFMLWERARQGGAVKFLIKVAYYMKKKTVLKNFAILKKTPVLKSLLNKVAGLQRCNFIKKRFQHRSFLVKFSKYLRTFTEERLRTAASSVLLDA